MEINHLEYVPIAEYSIVFGKEMADAELINLLSGIECQKIIVILARLESLHIAVCQQIKEAVCLDWQLRVLHSSHIKEKGGNWIQYNQYRTIMCPQSIFEAEKWAIAYCPVEDDITPITIPDLMLVMDVILAVNDRLPKEEVSGHELEYLYLMLYYNTHKIIKNQIARSYYVFSVLAKNDHQNIIEFVKRYVEKKGYSIEDRLAVLFNYLGIVIPDYTIEGLFYKNLGVDIQDFNAKGLASAHEKVCKSVRIGYKQAKKNAHDLIDQIWNFELFYRFPFIQIGKHQIAFSETTIVYQMWEGLYWDVRFAFEDDGEHFMAQFGHPFEHYVQEIIGNAAENSKGNVLFQNEFLYKYKGFNKASTDCYIRIDNTLIAFEVKAKSPHSSTLTGVDREAIEKELDDIMIMPVKQALDRLMEIYSDNNDLTEDVVNFFKDIEQVIIISVSMEKVQPIGELLYKSDQALKELAETNVVAYHNINIEECEVICNLIETCSDELSAILIKWFNDQRLDSRSAVTLANFLISIGKRFVCSDYVSEMFNASMREISIKTFGKDLTVMKTH